MASSLDLPNRLARFRDPTAAVALTAILALCAWCAAAAVEPSSPAELDEYNVVWSTPSKDSAGSMPLGNGEVGINLWVEENGDLVFLVARSDALSEVSRLLKVGRVRVSLSPNPLTSGGPFRQELRLRNGVCEIVAGTGQKKIMLRVFVQSDRPVVHVLGESESPISGKATAECWRTVRAGLWRPRSLPHQVQRGHLHAGAEAFWQTLADLNNIAGRLSALPETPATAEQRALFARMKTACPAVPIEEVEQAGKKVPTLPAEPRAAWR